MTEETKPDVVARAIASIASETIGKAERIAP